jgi:hypothetical protein
MFVDGKLKESVEVNSDSLNVVVDSIVGNYTKELDDYVANLKSISFSDSPDMTNSEIYQSLMFISSSMYSLVPLMEKTFLKQSIANALTEEAYNTAYIGQEDGTVEFKKSMANSKIDREKVIALVYKHASNRIKNTYNAADNIYSALKKIASAKVAEMQLGMKEQ